MAHYKATYGFMRFTPLNRAIYAKNQATKLTGHLVFTTPPFTPLVEDGKADDVIEAVEAYELNHGDHEANVLKIKDDELGGICKAIADYVSSKSGGNKEMIESGGCIANKDKQPSEKPPYYAETSREPGKMILHCDKDKGDLSIVWLCYKGKTPPVNIKDYSFLTAISCAEVEVSGLDSGSYYNFIACRVRSKNKGIVVFLDPIVNIVR